VEEGYCTGYSSCAMGWIYLFSNTSRMAVGLTQPPISWLLAIVSPEVELYVYCHMPSPAPYVVYIAGATSDVPHDSA